MLHNNQERGGLWEAFCFHSGTKSVNVSVKLLKLLPFYVNAAILQEVNIHILQ